MPSPTLRQIRQDAYVARALYDTAFQERLKLFGLNVTEVPACCARGSALSIRATFKP